MKYKKYIFILLIAMMFGTGNVYAEPFGGGGGTSVVSDFNDINGQECYYTTKDTNEGLFIRMKIWKTSNTNGSCGNDYCVMARMDKFGKKFLSKSPVVANYYKDNSYKDIKIYKYQKNGDSCPKYAYSIEGDEDKVYVTDNISDVEKIKKSIKDKKVYSSTADNKDGKSLITKNLYDKSFKSTTMEWDEDPTITCKGLFGPKKGEEGYEQGLRSLVDEILEYVRIIVPIIIILLGIIDFAKAVIASKEDEMKKAQTTFVKRLIVGIAVFFVPVIVDLIMDLADIVWNGSYSSCDL